MTALVSEKAVSDRWLPRLAWLTVFGIVYGSLMPFVYRPVPLDQAIVQFQNLRWYSLSSIGRADLVANLVLYLPFGFFVCGSLSRRMLAGAAILTALMGIGLAVGVEFLQIWASPRTVSLNDVVAEIAGTAIGIAAWVWGGRKICDLVQAATCGSYAALKAGLLLYLGVYLFIEISPFDFFVSMSELNERLYSGHPVVWISDHYGTGFRAAAGMLNKVVSAFPIGALIHLYSRRWKESVVFGLALSFGIEVVQFFEISGDADILSLVLRFAGFATGFAVLAALNPTASAMPIWITRASWAAIPIYVVFLHLLLNVPLDNPLQDHAAILAQTHLLPFYYYYFTPEGNALASLVNYLKVYLPLGAIIWLIGGARDKGIAWPVLGAIITQTGLEAVGFWFYWRRPDMTNVLIAALGGGLGFISCVWLRRSLADGLASRAQTPPWPRGTADDANASAADRASSSARIILICITIFIVYASLYPFDFTGSALTDERFRRLTVLGVARSSRGDIAGNILLFVPFGFSAVIALKEAVAGPAKRILMLLAAALGLAVMTQVPQLYLPTRDASIEDIVFNVTGAALGSGLGFRWGHLLGRLKVGSLTSAQGMFSFLWVATLLLPLMPSLDYSAIRTALSGLARPEPFHLGQAIPYTAGWLMLAELWKGNYRRYAAIVIAVLAVAPLATVRLNWLFLLAPAAAFAIAFLGKKIPMTRVVLLLLVAASLIAIHVDSTFMDSVSKRPWMNVLSGTVFFAAGLIYFAMKQGRAVPRLQQEGMPAKRIRSIPRAQREARSAISHETSGWARVRIGLRSDQIAYLNNVGNENGRSLSGATRYVISEFIKRLPQESHDPQARQSGLKELSSYRGADNAEARQEQGGTEHQHVVNLPDEHVVFLGALSAQLGTTISRTVQMIVDESIRERLASGSAG